MAIVRAKIITFFLNSFFKTPESGAQTTIFCAVDESVENESGLYYSDCTETRPSDRAMNEDDARRLWELSEQLTGLADKNNSKIKEIDWKATFNSLIKYQSTQVLSIPGSFDKNKKTLV